MQRRLWIAGIVMAVMATGITGAGEIGLTSVLFPEDKGIDVPMAGTQRAPAAQIVAKVRHRAGQSTIDVEYKQLPAAVLFGGDIVCYVVWAVSTDGSADNLGGIGGETDKGAVSFSTARRDFAMMITAEPLATVQTPGQHVVFFSGTPTVKNLEFTAFTFAGLSDRQGEIDFGRESIAGLTYKPDNKNPLGLIQAEKAAELLARFEAANYDRAGYDKAMAALTEARQTKGQKRLDAADRAIEAAGQALHKTAGMMKSEKAAAKAAQEAAERQAFAGETAKIRSDYESTSKTLAETETKLATAESDLSAARSEIARVQAGSMKLQHQRDALETQLSGALGKMATGTKTDRGYVVSLSGTAFPSGKSTLTTDAKYVLAKLSGMLLAMPDTSLSAEGHTDSMGGDELNRELSKARAEAVTMFLKEMGFSESRMTARGFGPDKPVAPNDTEEGRAKNRRVEIVLLEKR